MKRASSEVLRALGVALEMTGTEWSGVAIEATGAELAQYPEADVRVALARCAREVKGRLSLAQILERLPGQHPGVEIAWAMCARALSDERVTLVQTHEMARAFGFALRLADDPVAARMAFKQAYEQEVGVARATGGRPRWFVSPGTDAVSREEEVRAAIADGRLSAEYLRNFQRAETQAAELTALGVKALPRP